MKKHTPTPWKVSSYNDQSVMDAAGEAICHVQSAGDTFAKYDAAFIVRACNNHDGMLEALKKAVFAMDSVFHLTGNKEIYPYIEQARTAIAKAE